MAALWVVASSLPDGFLAAAAIDVLWVLTSGSLLGLASLADRIAIVNGNLRIDSTPGQGTTLRAEVPLAATGGHGG